MPNNVVKSFAKRSLKSVSEVEKLWKETEEEAKNKFPSKDPHYWAYVNKTVQNKLGLKKESMNKLSFIDYLSILNEKEDTKKCSTQSKKFEVGQVVQLCKLIKDIPDASIGETFSIIDIDEASGDIKIANPFGPDYQDTYFKKDYFTTI